MNDQVRSIQAAGRGRPGRPCQQDTHEVVECRRITGDDCYVMTAHVRSVEHLEQVIDRFADHGQTTTSIVQSSPVPLRGLSLATERTADTR